MAQLALALLMLALAGPSLAQRGKGSGGMMVERRDYEVKATGLVPLFPASHTCDPVASPWASPFRHDGSARRPERNGGLHGGIDISLTEGQPLLAIAAGKVIATGEGGNLEGFYLWLQHPPGETGRPHWSYSKYQHLRELPKLEPGARVAAGQEIARSGASGTAGPAFGPQGYPHLHLSVHIAPGAEYTLEGDGKSTVAPKAGKLVDPMLLFLPAGSDVAQAAELPPEAKSLPVAVVGRDGRISPAGSKVVWPVHCREQAG